ncbi:sulfotransferase domain-containing protein [Aphanothece sacrum]|uniref:sulfotransferase domain-containing protein n=1 Tax=Aphanothece sacrum TaxID=1122 RepID=UPI000F610AEF|nr:sulfotransferase domain-containing protein [Aphanothece sacrum]
MEQLGLVLFLIVTLMLSIDLRPFHRLQKNNQDIAELIKILKSNQISEQDIIHMYKSLLPAYPEIDKPPFFEKNFSSRFPIGRPLLYPLARKNNILRMLFREMYTPTQSPLLIFKEVGYIEIPKNLIDNTRMPIVYMVRHPCAVISSLIKGQNLFLMSTGRLGIINNLLKEYQPKLAEKYEGNIENMTMAAKQALLWYIEVEESFLACQDSPHGLVVIYEELVDNTLAVAEKVLGHFGLDLHQKTIDFIEKSTSSSPKQSLIKEFGMINKYFTIYRDSKQVRDKWKDKMSEEDQNTVREIVQSSKCFQKGVNLGLWN